MQRREIEKYREYMAEVHNSFWKYICSTNMKYTNKSSLTYYQKVCVFYIQKREKNPNHLCDCVLQSHKKMTLNWCLMSVFGWLKASRLACFFSHEITVHVLPEQYFSLTTISRNSIFQSCRTGPFFARPCLDSKFFHYFSITSNLWTHAWSIKCR